MKLPSSVIHMASMYHIYVTPLILPFSRQWGVEDQPVIAWVALTVVAAMMFGLEGMYSLRRSGLG